MKYKKKTVFLLNKINDKIIKNNINHCFSDINLLILKNLIENINILEEEKEQKKFLLDKIENYLEYNEEINHYTKVLDLTESSKQIIYEIYKDFGFKGCIDSILIKQHCKENRINYDLFFNQVDEIEEVLIKNYNLEKSSKYVFIGKSFVVNNIDNIEINLYFKEEHNSLKEKT